MFLSVVFTMNQNRYGKNQKQRYYVNDILDKYNLKRQPMKEESIEIISSITRRKHLMITSSMNSHKERLNRNLSNIKDITISNQSLSSSSLRIIVFHISWYG